MSAPFREPSGALGRLIAAARAASAVRRRARPTLTLPPRPEPHRFVAALRLDVAGEFPIIAEIKRASPSAGVLRGSVDPASLAHAYTDAGARCLSVLTEESSFGGSLADLALVRREVRTPLLRKDIIVDPYMVVEAAAAGADAILLIATALPPSLLVELAGVADEHGLDVLLELVHPHEREVLGLRDWPLVGVNARDLETLDVDPARFGRLAPSIAALGRLLVAESGVKSPADIRRYRGEGAHVALVGETLMRSDEPRQTLRTLRCA